MWKVSGTGASQQRPGGLSVTGFRLVSVIHPALADRAPLDRLAFLDGMDVMLIASDDIDPSSVPETVRLLTLPTRGANRLARYGTLRRTLATLQPDAIHLLADPRSVLAFQVARSCGPRPFVLDAEHQHGAIGAFRGSLLTRRTLARADAIIACDPALIARLRACGLKRLAVVAGRGERPGTLPARQDARRALDVPSTGMPVFGWAGPLGPRSLTDLLETLATCEHELAVLIPAPAPLRRDVLDRADALEILGRIRVVDCTDSPTMLAASDALIATPASAEAALPWSGVPIGLAQCHGVPAVYADLPGMTELVGAGGWKVAANDPGLLARLLDELSVAPDLIAAARQAALAEASRRNSPEAAGAALAGAIWGVHRGNRQPRTRPASWRALGIFRSVGKQEVSRT